MGLFIRFGPLSIDSGPYCNAKQAFYGLVPCMMYVYNEKKKNTHTHNTMNEEHNVWISPAFINLFFIMYTYSFVGFFFSTDSFVISVL